MDEKLKPQVLYHHIYWLFTLGQYKKKIPNLLLDTLVYDLKNYLKTKSIKNL